MHRVYALQITITKWQSRVYPDSTKQNKL